MSKFNKILVKVQRHRLKNKYLKIFDEIQQELEANPNDSAYRVCLIIILMLSTKPYFCSLVRTRALHTCHIYSDSFYMDAFQDIKNNVKVTIYISKEKANRNTICIKKDSHLTIFKNVSASKRCVEFIEIYLNTKHSTI